MTVLSISTSQTFLFPTHRSPGINVVNDRPMDVFQAVMGPLEDSIALYHLVASPRWTTNFVF